MGIVNQTGVILVVSLIFLAILALLGISSFERRILDVKITANEEQRLFAFYQAERGLKEAEERIQTEFQEEGGIQTISGFPCFYDVTKTLNTTAVVRLPRTEGLAILGSQAQWTPHNSCYSEEGERRFIVEYLGKSKAAGTYYFRITAMGLGKDRITSRVLRSHFAAGSDGGKRMGWSAVD